MDLLMVEDMRMGLGVVMNKHMVKVVMNKHLVEVVLSKHVVEVVLNKHMVEVKNMEFEVVGYKLEGTNASCM